MSILIFSFFFSVIEYLRSFIFGGFPWNLIAYSFTDYLQLIQILSSHQGEKLLLLSPMGGQGFLIGRGNLQLSPEVLRLIGIESILGVATPAKLIGLSNVRIDTGEDSLDEEFRAKKFVKMLQGYRTTRVIRVSDA